MKILLLNQDWFAEDFRAAGHEVVVAGFGRHFQVRFEYSILHIDSVIKALPDGFTPDAIVVYDESSPWFVAGLDETNIPVLFYSVDTQHHAHLHRYLALMADHTFIAQKDFIGPFHEIGVDPAWLPLWASRHVEPSPERQWDVCFVGNMDRTLNPWRVDFFEALKKKIDVFITRGQYWDYFPRSEIVINQTVKGDLNFRVFEAMMCGTLLLTEKSGNGLLELFQDGTHLVTYARGNVDQAADLINQLLSDRAHARRIAAAGREEILARHLPSHRAETILEVLKHLKRTRPAMRHVGALANFSALAASVGDLSKPFCLQALLNGLKAARGVLAQREPLPTDAACYLVRASMMYDRLTNSTAGAELLLEFCSAYPTVPVLGLAHVRGLLNRGAREDAEEWVRGHFQMEPAEAFSAAERIITQILSASEQKSH